VQVLVVGAAMSDRGHHSPQLFLRKRTTPDEIHRPGNSAHSLSLVVSSTSVGVRPHPSGFRAVFRDDVHRSYRGRRPLSTSQDAESSCDGRGAGSNGRPANVGRCRTHGRRRSPSLGRAYGRHTRGNSSRTGCDGAWRPSVVTCAFPELWRNAPRRLDRERTGDECQYARKRPCRNRGREPVPVVGPAVSA